MPGVLFGMAAQAQSPAAPGADAHEMAKITPEMIDAAAVIAGVSLTAEQKTMMLEGLTKQRDSVAVIRTMKIPNSVAPAFVFDPVPGGMVLATERRPMRMSPAPAVAALASTGFRGLGVCFGARIGGVGEDAKGDFSYVDEDVSGAFEKVRPTVTFCDYVDGGAGSRECGGGG